MSYLKFANSTMYAAKQANCNTYRVFVPGMAATSA
jgi:hypothetical protein